MKMRLSAIPFKLIRTPLVLACALAVLPAPAAVDGLEVAKALSSMSLQWENIRASANWIAGHIPLRDPVSGLLGVELGSGNQVAIHVPAHAVLRIVALDNSALAPRVSLSQGTGLAIEMQTIPALDGRSWLVRTDSSQSAVIHIRGHDQKIVSQRFALFLARFKVPTDLSSFRNELPLPGSRVQVRRADEAVGKEHVRVSAGIPLSTKVHGPDSLLFEYRLDTPEVNRSMLTSVEISLGDQPVRTVRQPTGAETVAPVKFDAEWHAASRREQVIVDIPPGEHTLVLRSSHPLVVRAASAGAPDLLLPELNLPPQWKDIQPDRAIEEIEQASVAAAESNQWRDIGRLAGERFLAAARQRTGLRNVVSAADELNGQFVQYQDLLPSGAGTSRILPFLVSQPQPPDEPVRHQIVNAMAVSDREGPPTSRFHNISAQGLRFKLPAVGYPMRLRFMLPADAGASQLEISHGDTVLTLNGGAPQLDPERLRLTTPVQSLLTAGGGGLTSNDQQKTRPFLLSTEVVAVEWQVPAETKDFTLRSLAGKTEVAVQWAASTEYFLDDEFLALQLQSDPRVPLPGSQGKSAVQPFLRMLAAARSQYVANVSPASHHSGATNDVVAGRAAAAAAIEIEPARAVGLWQQALRSSTPADRAVALRGLANALFTSGDRFGGERLLRSHWIGSDADLSRTAEKELRALYARESDTAMELLFASAAAHSDPSSFGLLSQLLAENGEDRLALLGGIISPKPDIPALLQSALRIGYWQTFDTLLAQLPDGVERHTWGAHKALRHGRIDEADALFVAAGKADWSESLREARALAPTLQSGDGDQAGAVVRWLTWQARHPGPRAWQSDPQSVGQYGGGILLRSTALNLRSQWWKADATQPLVARVLGPARVRIEARPLHSAPASVMSGWVQVRSKGQLWVVPFSSNQASPGLISENGTELPGALVTRDVVLPAGLHELQIDAGGVPLAARVLQQRASLQLPVLPAPDVAHFELQRGVVARPYTVSQCGAERGCLLLVSQDGLTPLRMKLEPVSWPGFPAPFTEADPAAGRLAAGDVDGALAQTADPLERMRLLLWLAESDPAARARALALGADLANRHPTPEIRSQWEQLSANSSWVLVPLVDRSAGLRQIESAVGTPESPVGRIRAALLPALRPGELRIGGDSRANFVSEQLKTYPLKIELTLDDLPGLPTLPVTLQVLRNGRSWQTVQLTAQAPVHLIDLRMLAGAQTVSVVLQQPYANQYVRVRFNGPVQPELTTVRDWQISTAAEPVRLTVAGPVAVRIDRLEADGVRSEERLVKDQTSTLVLPPRTSASESLYRVYLRRLQPGTPASPPARPNDYQPLIFPEAPPPWSDAALPLPRQVRFIDSQPLTAQPDHTLTLRSGLQLRRDNNATGGATVPLTDRYFETGASWRRGNEDATYWSMVDGLIRLPKSGAPVLGVSWATEREMGWTAERPWPFTVQTSLDSFVQSTPHGTGISVTARASAGQTRAISSTLSHTPSVGLLARWLNLNNVSDSSRVDSDVFTKYRATHSRALTASETLSWRPWRDSHLAARVHLVTNPDLNFLRPDQMGVDLMWRQLLGRTRLELGLRTTRYSADADRASTSVTRQWRLGTGSDWWLADGSRVELVTSLNKDSAQRSAWGGIELRWHWGPGRQFRDFSPSELDFRALRSWQVPTTNNRIEERR